MFCQFKITNHFPTWGLYQQSSQPRELDLQSKRSRQALGQSACSGSHTVVLADPGDRRAVTFGSVVMMTQNPFSAACPPIYQILRLGLAERGIPVE